MKRYLPFFLIGAVLIVATVTGWWMYRSAQNPAAVAPASTSPTPTTAAATETTSPTPTPTDAPITKTDVVLLEEFGDYQCPPCGGLHPILNQLKKEFGDRLRFEFIHFPLEQIHANAVPAAMTSVAASMQGKFMAMHNLLYETQKEWSETKDFSPFALDYAQRAGLDVERFKMDVNSMTVRQRLASDFQRVQARKVDSTPTVFLNGAQIPNEKYAIEDLRKEIKLRLLSAK